MILEDIDRFINPDQIIDRVVYDLDAIVSEQSVPTELGNDDEQRFFDKFTTISASLWQM